MKKLLTIIKMTFALSGALIIGVWFGTNLDIIDKQANAIAFTMDIKPSNVERQIEKEAPEPSGKSTDVIEPQQTNKVKATTTESKTKENVILTEELVYEILLSFEAPIYWAIADNDVLVDYTSTEQLLTEHYAKFANLDLARSFVYAFFSDQDGEVRLLPGQLPTIFQPELEVEMIYVSENEYKVKQAQTGYDGSTIFVVFEFKFDEANNDWKLGNILYE